MGILHRAGRGWLTSRVGPAGLRHRFPPRAGNQVLGKLNRLYDLRCPPAAAHGAPVIGVLRPAQSAYLIVLSTWAFTRPSKLVGAAARIEQVHQNEGQSPSHEPIME